MELLGQRNGIPFPLVQVRQGDIRCRVHAPDVKPSGRYGHPGTDRNGRMRVL